MTYLRTVGSALIAISAVAGGMLVSVYYRRRLSILKELRRFIEYIALETECSSRTLDEIYQSFDFTPVLSCFGGKLRENGWDGAIAELKLLDYDTITVISRFSASIGMSGLVSTLKLCEETSSALRLECEKSENGLDGRIKVTSSLCVACGLMLALLCL